MDYLSKCLYSVSVQATSAAINEINYILIFSRGKGKIRPVNLFKSLLGQHLGRLSYSPIVCLHLPPFQSSSPNSFFLGYSSYQEYLPFSWVAKDGIQIPPAGCQVTEKTFLASAPLFSGTGGQ